MEIEEIKRLVETKKFTVLKNKLQGMNSADISEILDELEDKESVIIVFRLLPKEKAGMTFSHMESDMRQKLIQDLTDAELKGVLDELFMDDTVDLIEEMPSNIVPKILKAISKEDRKIVNELLKYPEDSAGSIMTTEFIDLKENMTAEEALKRIRKIATDSETIYTCGNLATTFAISSNSWRVKTEPVGLQGDENNINLVLSVIAFSTCSALTL